MITKRINRRSEGFFWIIIGVIICLLAWQTHLGSFKEPGPGFMAFAIGLFMVGVGLFMIFTSVLVTASRKDDRSFANTFASVSWSRILYVLGFLFAYAVLLEPLGYILTTSLVLLGLFYDWNKKNWFLSLILSLVTTGSSYVFFEKLLGLRFPAGILP